MSSPLNTARTAVDDVGPIRQILWTGELIEFGADRQHLGAVGLGDFRLRDDHLLIAGEEGGDVGRLIVLAPLADTVWRRTRSG